jgi:hypothetical protein
VSYGVFRPPPWLETSRATHHLPLATLTQKDTWLWVSFPTPTSAPSGTEEFAIRVRRTGAGGNNPTVRIELWESGTFRATALADTAVTSTTGEVLRGTWNASSLVTTNGSAVEAYIYGTTSSDGNRVEIGAVEWNASPAGEVQPITLVGMVGIRGEA